MPRDGAGTYTLPVNSVDPAVFNTTISDVDFNATMNDVASSLTGSWSRSGNGAALADMLMGGFKLRNVGAPSVGTDAARLTDLTLGGDVTGVLATNTVANVPGGVVTGLAAGAFPAAGKVGQVLTSTTTAVSMLNNTPKTVASIAVTAGNWLITANGHVNFVSPAVPSQFSCAISTVDNAFTVAGDARGDNPTFGAAGTVFQPAGSVAVSNSGTVTYYLVCYGLFTAGGSVSGGGTITAVRLD